MTADHRGPGSSLTTNASRMPLAHHLSGPPGPDHPAVPGEDTVQQGPCDMHGLSDCLLQPQWRRRGIQFLCRLLLQSFLLLGYSPMP